VRHEQDTNNYPILFIKILYPVFVAVWEQKNKKSPPANR